MALLTRTVISCLLAAPGFHQNTLVVEEDGELRILTHSHDRASPGIYRPISSADLYALGA
jgi:hypothetical protein